MSLNNSAGYDLLDQRQLTAQHGEFVTVLPALPCSCRADETPDEHAPDPMCRICHGTGRAYGQSQRVKGVVTGLTPQNKSLTIAGLVLPADLIFTPDPQPTLAVHDYDVIRLGYALPHEGDVLLRGVRDELDYLPGRVWSVVHHDAMQGTATSYTPDVDFTLDGRTLTWLAGHGPAPGMAYSVRYDAYFDWVVYPGLTLRRVKRGTSLGQAVLLRKRHLAGFRLYVP